jgi:ribonuclease Z
VRYGAGADLLVHEVAMAPPELLGKSEIQRLINHPPQDAGRVDTSQF